MTPTPDTCGTCTAWQGWTGENPDPADTGECHAAHPVLMDPQGKALRPETRRDGWCREFGAAELKGSQS